VKPDNVFVTRDEDGADLVKLLDFGLAKLTTDSSRGPRTQPGFPMGTPHYMAPEQCRGHAVDARTDLYSFGVMAYELIVGELPFARDTVAEMLSAQLYASPPAPSSRSNVFGAEVDRAFERLLAKDPKDRPGSAREAITMLNEACSRLDANETSPAIVLARPAPPTPAPTPLTLVTPAAPAPTRTHWPYVLVLIGSVCVGATLAFFVRRSESSNDSHPSRLEQPSFAVDEEREDPPATPALAQTAFDPVVPATTSADSIPTSSASATAHPSTTSAPTGSPPTGSKNRGTRPNRATPTALENPFK
jgi:serine/threonine protein kinase